MYLKRRRSSNILLALHFLRSQLSNISAKFPVSHRFPPPINDFRLIDANFVLFSSLAGVNIGGRKLISRFPMQQWLDVKSNWTEREDKTEFTRMKYDFRVTCFDHYYGSGCANLCRPRDDNFGHYECNQNGEIVCLEGWKGDYCTKRE